MVELVRVVLVLTQPALSRGWLQKHQRKMVLVQATPVVVWSLTLTQ